MTEITFRNHLRPGDMGYLIHLMGYLYAQEYNLGIENEIEMAEFLTHFLKNHNRTCERLWIADLEGQIVGSIAIVAESDGTTAHLRSLILHPSVRGRGLGKKLINKALDFCREADYEKIVLETFDELKAAIYLYEKAGFQKISESEHALWGRLIREWRYELVLRK